MSGTETSNNWIESNEIGIPQNNLPNFFSYLSQIIPENTDPEDLRIINEAIATIVKIGSSYLVDGGCGGPSITLFLPGKDPITENPVFILNRSGFMNYLKERNIDDGFDRRIEILDIQEFRRCDMVKSPNGENGAEIVLRRVAEKLTERCEEINKIFKDEGIQSQITVCRYGGDEFGILYEINPEDEDKIQDIVKGLINNYNSDSFDICPLLKLYLTGGKIEEDGSITTDIEGIFLDEDNKTIVHKPVSFKSSSSSPYEKDKEEITSITDDLSTRTNIINIVGSNPKLREMMEQVNIIANNISPEQRDELYIEFEKFLRNIVCDPLLSHNVETIRSMVETHMDKPFSRITVIDMSGLKEINDIFGLDVGDAAIKEVWKKILSVLKEDDTEYTGVEEIRYEGIMFFRKGSTIFMCANDSDIPDFVMDTITSINNITVTKDNKIMEAPVAVSSFYPERGYRPDPMQIKELIGNMLNNVREIHNERGILSLVNSSDDISDMLENIPSKDDIMNGSVIINEGNFFLFWLFNGKRSLERLTSVINTITKMTVRILSEEYSDGDRALMLEKLENIHSALILKQLSLIQ